MERGEKRYKCYVCRKMYPPDDLGRCRLPLWNGAVLSPYFRVVCETCYAAITVNWEAITKTQVPVYHGF